MFSRLFKTPRSSLQLFREECAETCQMYERCRQFSAETFSSLPIIRKDGLIGRIGDSGENRRVAGSENHAGGVLDVSVADQRAYPVNGTGNRGKSVLLVHVLENRDI